VTLLVDGWRAPASCRARAVRSWCRLAC